jgi:hypothetical protein
MELGKQEQNESGKEERRKQTEFTKFYRIPKRFGSDFCNHVNSVKSVPTHFPAFLIRSVHKMRENGVNLNVTLPLVAAERHDSRFQKRLRS